MTAATSNATVTAATEVCTLPVVCLQTANFDLTVGDVIKDKNTIIDLWTTRCTRCPAALDALNQYATREGDAKVTSSELQCISICCGDTLDGAREIIEATMMPRWGAIQHYFMEYQHKERCKQLLNFRQVPFYIVFDRNGTLLYSGNQKLDWQTLFEEQSSSRYESIRELPSFDTKAIKLMEDSVPSPTSTTTEIHLQHQIQENSTLVIEDMDF